LVATNLIETLPDATAAPSLAWPTDWVNVWLPLETWGQFNGLGKPVQFGGDFRERGLRYVERPLEVRFDRGDLHAECCSDGAPLRVHRLDQVRLVEGRWQIAHFGTSSS
jgi:hypothetical protein